MCGTLLVRLTVKAGKHLGLQKTQILTHDCLTCRDGDRVAVLDGQNATTQSDVMLGRVPVSPRQYRDTEDRQKIGVPVQDPKGARGVIRSDVYGLIRMQHRCKGCRDGQPHATRPFDVASRSRASPKSPTM